MRILVSHQIVLSAALVIRLGGLWVWGLGRKSVAMGRCEVLVEMIMILFVLSSSSLAGLRQEL